MPLESPQYPQWTPAQVAEYLCAHLSGQPTELLDEVEATVTEECFDGQALQAAVASEAKWQLALQRLLPKFADEPAAKWLGGIPTKLALVEALALSDPAAALRDMRYDAHFPEGDLWCLAKGGQPYYCPAGWTRYGLTPPRCPAGEDIYADWPVAYHTADACNVAAIITQGVLPEINPRHGEEPVILLSPSVRYSSNWVFNEPKKVGDRWLLTVFQVRVRPGAYQVQPNTLDWDGGWEDRQVLFDPLYAQDELEWLVHYRHPEDVVVTGLMVKLLDQHPAEYLQQYFQRRKALQTHPRSPAAKVQWQWNCAPEKTLEKTGPWQPFEEETSDRIEKAYQAYREALFVGPVGHGAHCYFIDFRALEMHAATGAAPAGRPPHGWERRAVSRRVL
eukprot:EG_transcript_12092